jgi:hypothetical protein
LDLDCNVEKMLRLGLHGAFATAVPVYYIENQV